MSETQQKPTREENLQALVEEMGLQTKKDVHGKDVLVNKDGVPINANPNELADIWYPELQTRIISQSLESLIDEIPLIGKIWTKEDWVNGMKDYIATGQTKLKDYVKETSMDLFNPGVVKSLEKTFKVELRKYASIELNIEQLISAFTTPASLDSFISSQIASLLESFKLFYFDLLMQVLNEEEVKVWTQDGTEVKKKFMEYDGKIDVTGLTVLETLKEVRKKIRTLQVPHKGHLALADPNFRYQVKSENLVAIFDSNYYSDLEDEEAKLFNLDRIAPGITKEILDFETAGINTNKKVILADKRKLRFGVQVDNYAWDVKAPQGKLIKELQNHWGIASLPTYGIWAFEGTLASAKAEDKK